MREGTQEGGKGRKGRRDGRESVENGSRNLAGASKSTPDDAKWGMTKYITGLSGLTGAIANITGR